MIGLRPRGCLGLGAGGKDVMSEQNSADFSGHRDVASFGVRRATDFDHALGHSARVRWARRLVPIGLGLSLAAMVAVPLLNKLKMSVELPFELGTLHLSGSRLTMQSPILSGFTDDNRAYRVTAASAIQNLDNPDALDLDQITARIDLANTGWAKVTAKRGTVIPKQQHITLVDGVEFETDSGYQGHLKDAAIDAKGGSVTTTSPVVLTYRSGKLVADSMTVMDRGSRARFEGHVQVDFRMSDMSGPKAAPQSGKSTPAAAAPPSGGK